MSESEKSKTPPDAELLAPSTSSPLVFISHDARDAELAEAFSKLLKSVSAGMIKTFRSSDKKGTEGIDFGEEWYKRLMAQLQERLLNKAVQQAFSNGDLDRIAGEIAERRQDPYSIVDRIVQDTKFGRPS